MEVGLGSKKSSNSDAFFYYNRYLEEGLGGVKETELRTGFILSRTRSGADRRRHCASRFCSVCSPELTTFSFPLSSLAPQSPRESFCQPSYRPKVLCTGGGLASLPLGQPNKPGAQSTLVCSSVSSPPSRQPPMGWPSGHFLTADMQLTETRDVCFGAK